MKRREFFKFFSALAAVPFATPLLAMCKPAPTYDHTFYVGPVGLTANDDLFGTVQEWPWLSDQELNLAVTGGFHKWNQDTLPESNILKMEQIDNAKLQRESAEFHLVALINNTPAARSFPPPEKS